MDVTVQAWQLLNIVKQVQRDGGNVTLSKLAELARSTGKGSFVGGDGGGGGGRKRGRKSGGGGKEQVELDLDVVCGGKVNLKREVGVFFLSYFHFCFHSYWLIFLCVSLHIGH